MYAFNEKNRQKMGAFPTFQNIGASNSDIFYIVIAHLNTIVVVPYSVVCLTIMSMHAFNWMRNNRIEWELVKVHFEKINR